MGKPKKPKKTVKAASKSKPKPKSQSKSKAKPKAKKAAPKAKKPAGAAAGVSTEHFGGRTPSLHHAAHATAPGHHLEVESPHRSAEGVQGRPRSTRVEVVERGALPTQPGGGPAGPIVGTPRNKP